MDRRNQDDDITGTRKVWPKIADAVEEHFTVKHSLIDEGIAEGTSGLAPLEIDELVDLSDDATLPRLRSEPGHLSSSDKDLILLDGDDISDAGDPAGYAVTFEDVLLSSQVHDAGDDSSIDADGADGLVGPDTDWDSPIV